MLFYNPFNQTSYAYSSAGATRGDLCVIGPDFQLGKPLATPLENGQYVDHLTAIDNGDQGALLLTTYSLTEYITWAIDPSTGSIIRVPSLDAVYPVLTPAEASQSIYGLAAAGRQNQLQR